MYRSLGLGGKGVLELRLGTHDVLSLWLVIQHFLRPSLGDPASSEGHFEDKAGGQK